jgi:hypothetical protein
MARRFPGSGLDPVLAVATRRGPLGGGMSSTAQFENIWKKNQYFLLTTYYDKTHSSFSNGSWRWLARSTQHLRTGKESSRRS